MMTIYKVYYYEMTEDAYGYPKSRKVEKYFSTEKKAEDFAKEVDGKTEEIEVE